MNDTPGHDAPAPGSPSGEAPPSNGPSSNVPSSDAPPVAPASAQADSHCAQVLVVDAGGALAVMAEQALEESGQPASVRRVGDYLMALGDLATHGPPDALLGRLDGLNDLQDEPQTTARALRRLAPRTRMLLLVQQDQAALAEAATGAGFDEYFIEPVRMADLYRAMQSRNGQPPDAESDSTTAAAPASITGFDSPPPGGEAGRGAERSRANDTEDESHESLSPPSPAPPSPSSPPPATPISAVNFPDLRSADVAMLDQLLNARPGVRQVAMAALAQQSHIAALAWTDQAQDAPADHAVQPVTHGDTTFGALHAPPPATADALAPWAQWLGHWLAMDQRLKQLWEMALRDELTGAWNRRYFNRCLHQILQRAVNERFRVTVLMFDIDDFKSYNDRYGHAAGDQILRESARLMQSVVREHDVVARIGGDEFGVIFWDAEGPRRPNSQHPADVRHAAERFQKAICNHQFPKLLDEAPGTLTISGGLASFPWDGRTPEELMALADQMAMQSKRQGKNAITFGPGAKRVCAPYPD